MMLKHSAHDNPDDPYCLHKNSREQIAMLPSDWMSCLLSRASPQKIHRSLESPGIVACTPGMCHPSTDGGHIIGPIKPAGKSGHNYPNAAIKLFCKLCGSTNDLTARSLRRLAATRVGNSGASALHQAQKTRHALAHGGSSERHGQLRSSFSPLPIPDSFDSRTARPARPVLLRRLTTLCV